jgi:hypothetical protein
MSSAAVCPMCHYRNSQRAKECADCGYEFGQSIDTLRGMLSNQLLNQRIMFWVLAVADLCLIGVIVLGVMYGFLIFPLMPFLFVTYQAVRTVQKISITKQSMRMIADKQLPKATVVSG